MFLESGSIDCRELVKQQVVVGKKRSEKQKEASGKKARWSIMMSCISRHGEFLFGFCGNALIYLRVVIEEYAIGF
jgi:hypothetical protein